MAGKALMPGEGPSFAPGMWESAADRGVTPVDRPVPHDPLVMMKDWPTKGKTFVGLLSELNQQRKEAGLPPHVPEEREEKKLAPRKKKSKAKMIKYGGKAMSAAEWAKELGITVRTFRERMDRHGEAKAIEMGEARTWKSRHRDTAIYTYKDVTKSHAEWAKELGIAVSSFRSRVRRHPDNPEKVMAPPMMFRARS